MIDFLFRSATREDWEAMARTALFIDEENKPLPGITIDPAPGTSEYESGIPIIDVPGSGGAGPEAIPPVMKTGWHCNVRVSGEREQEEVEGLSQTDEEGKLLPVAARTHFGIAFSSSGTAAADSKTEGVSNANVALIDETTIASPQRVWQ